MSTSRRLLTGLSITALAAGLVGALASPASAGVPATAPPVVGTPPSAVRATGLPTAQLTGVAFAQVVIGDTVYVGGDITAARPAGVAAGGRGEVKRHNLLAYSLSTGKLVKSFAPNVDNTVQALAASPDGKRLYVGGLFTSVNGNNRYRIAAFDTATGTLSPTFKPVSNYRVSSISATNSTVYLGGKFNTVNGVARTNLAAVRADTGALLRWHPVADASVMALVVSPNGNRVVVGGAFATLNGVTAHGIGSLDAKTGATQAYPVNQLITSSYGARAAFLSLTTDGKAVYGTSYNYGAGTAFEGTFSANPNTGAVNWVEDCHGDTYGAWSDGTTVYTVGHAHDCSTVGGFPQVASAGLAHRTVAFTAAAAGTVQHNTVSGYMDLAGQRAPSIRQWFPKLASGTDGSDQAAWTVTGTKNYVLLAGEFPSVNGTAQQGMVRFATAPTSPDTQGPQLVGTGWQPTITAAGATGTTITIGSNWDRDDLTLDYRITRDQGTGTAAKTVYSAAKKAEEWNRPTLTATDKGLRAGVTYRYRVYATDAAGNTAASPFVSFTVARG